MFIVGHLLPDDGVLTGLVLCFSLHTDELNAAGVQGGGDPNLRGGGQRDPSHNKLHTATPIVLLCVSFTTLNCKQQKKKL